MELQLHFGAHPHLWSCSSSLGCVVPLRLPRSQLQVMEAEMGARPEAEPLHRPREELRAAAGSAAVGEIVKARLLSADVAWDDIPGSAPPSPAEDLTDSLKHYSTSIHEDKYHGWWPTINMVPMELKRGDENKCYEPVAVQIGMCRRPSKSEEFRQQERYKSRCVQQLMNSHLCGSFHKRMEEVLNASKSVAVPEEFQQLERYKSRCVQQLMNRCKRRRPGLTLDCCYARMEELYHEVLGCHNKRILVRVEPDPDYLTARMLLDGCFILNRLLKFARPEKNRQGRADDDEDWIQAGGRCFVWQLVTRDLLLLENQIPFIVLSELFDRLKIKDDADEDTLVKGSLMLFRYLCPQMLRCPDSFVSTIAKSGQVHHLLHLFYLFVGFPDETRLRRREDGGVKTPRDEAADEWPPAERPQWIPGAKELEEAGVRLRKRKGAPTTTTFLDIKFDLHTGVLEIPPLELYDYSEALFRNMIAFEQTCPGTKYDVSTYVVFMNCLVTTPEDMRILHLHGILTNMINGEQDASRFFDRICSQVHFPSENYLAGVMGDVNKYKNRRRHKWRATLVRDYFSNPWASISVVAAVLLLGMTMLQTFFAVYAYYKPPS